MKVKCFVRNVGVAARKGIICGAYYKGGSEGLAKFKPHSTRFWLGCHPSPRCRTPQVRTVRRLLEAGYDVFSMDADLVFYRHFLVHLPEFDITFSCNDDSGPHQKWGRCAAPSGNFRCKFNGGFYFVRSTPTVTRFVRRAEEICFATGRVDQDIFLRLSKEPGWNIGCFNPCTYLNAGLLASGVCLARRLLPLSPII